MKLKNIEVMPFYDFIMSFDLIGKESRLRTRFAKMLLERSSIIKEEHGELIRQFAKFDDDGEPFIIEVNGQKAYDITDRDTFNKEYYMLMNEDFIVTENEERKEMLLFIKDIILNCEKTFKGREALEYDAWCERVDEINYE
jgi:hypothetical protein